MNTPHSRHGSEATRLLLDYLSETRTLQRYIIEALEIQQHEEGLRAQPAAADVLQRVFVLLEEHVQELDHQIQLLGFERRATLHQATTVLAGNFMFLFCKTRARQAAKMLRDDYMVLSSAASSYTLLHTAAMALHQTSLSALALTHLRSLAALITEIGQLLPSLVVSEISKHVDGLGHEIAEAALRNAQDSWSLETRYASGF